MTGKQARIKPNFVKSQYSKTEVLLDGFNLHIEGGSILHFHNREAAQSYASYHNLTLVYSGQNRDKEKGNENLALR